MTLKVNKSFFKVIVLSVGLIETVIVDEKHFPDRNGVNDYVRTLDNGLIGVLVEI